MPGGLFPDQAANGEDALAILHGDARPFYERGNGREALLFYVQAAMIALFGIGVWPMFLASALVGIATVWATYAAALRLFGERAALFSALFLATNPWHVTVSRTGFRAVMVPLFIALALYFAVGVARATTQRRRILEAIGAGAAFGLGWYTYISYRVFAAVILLAGISLLIEDLIQRPRFSGMRRYGGAILIAAVTAAAVAAPLALYFIGHPDAFAGRVGHVSILNPDLNNGDVAGTAAHVLRDSVLAFFTAGDRNPRHNVSGFPQLSPIPAMFLIVGLAIALLRSFQYLQRVFRGRRPGRTLPYALALLLVLFMLAPEVTTAEGIPHGLRAIGEIPAVFWLSGAGAAWVVAQIRRITSPSVRMLAQGAIGALLALTIAYELALYFGVSASDPRFWYEYRSDLTVVSNYLNERAREGKPHPYLALDAFSVQTVHFLTTDAGYPYRLVRPEESSTVTLARGEAIVFTQSTLPDAKQFLRDHPSAIETERVRNRFGEDVMIVYARDGERE